MFVQVQAQIIIDDVDISEMDIKYVEIVAVSKFMSNKITVRVDYGQDALTGQKMKDRDGKALVFASVVNALNFMDKNGWEFISNYVVTEANQNVYHYLFRKKDE